MNPSALMTTQAAVDPVFSFLFGAALLLLLGITGAMVWFVFRYHKSRAPQATSQVAYNLWLELAWTVLPTLLVLAMFWYGWAGYLALRNVPQGALEVTATARMWSWRFDYPGGQTSNKLYVPVGKPVRVTLKSEDVLHAFYVPAFRVKRDMVPGMSNYVWFAADKAGSYDLFCAEYCGTGHAAMITTIEALPPQEFEKWLVAQSEAAAPPGRTLLEKTGCLGCHSLDGSASLGPTFKGLYGSRVTVLKDGKELTVTADAAFLRESIVAPAATLVVGFPPVMPPYPALSSDELAAILAFLETLR